MFAFGSARAFEQDYQCRHKSEIASRTGRHVKKHRICERESWEGQERQQRNQGFEHDGDDERTKVGVPNRALRVREARELNAKDQNAGEQADDHILLRGKLLARGGSDKEVKQLGDVGNEGKHEKPCDCPAAGVVLLRAPGLESAYGKCARDDVVDKDSGWIGVMEADEKRLGLLLPGGGEAHAAGVERRHRDEECDGCVSESGETGYPTDRLSLSRVGKVVSEWAGPSWEERDRRPAEARGYG